MTLANDDQPTLLLPSQLERAAGTLAASFDTDPLWQYLFPDGTKRRQTLQQFFQAVIALSLARQQAYHIGASLEGIAVWESPGQPRNRLPLSVLWRFGQLVASPFALAAFRVRAVFAQFERMRRAHATQPHYYLQTIGVRPDAQGQRYASRLIRPFLQQADTRKLGAYTETVTPGNVALYEHLGFQIVETCQIPNLPLTLWGFYRSPSDRDINDTTI
jgi:ribosomal protein S18 acetylase RimI-like enzyme